MPPTGDLLRKVFRIANNLYLKTTCIRGEGFSCGQGTRDKNSGKTITHSSHTDVEDTGHLQELRALGAAVKLLMPLQPFSLSVGCGKCRGSRPALPRASQGLGTTPVVNPLSAPSTSLLSAWLVMCRLCLSNQRTDSSKQRHSILKVKDFILSVVSRAQSSKAILGAECLQNR